MSVRILPGFGERDPDAMLECAKGSLDTVIIIGWSDDGFFFSSSYENNRDILWDLELAKQDMLR